MNLDGFRVLRQPEKKSSTMRFPTASCQPLRKWSERSESGRSRSASLSCRFSEMEGALSKLSTLPRGQGGFPVGPSSSRFKTAQVAEKLPRKAVNILAGLWHLGCRWDLDGFRSDSSVLESWISIFISQIAGFQPHS